MSTITHAATFPTGTPFSGATPNPAYSNIYIPILWSTKLIEKFYDASVLPAIANRTYEGEIRNKGDHVIIRRRPTLTVRSYETDIDLVVDRPSASEVELLIDKGIYWNAALDDVMEVQSDLNLMNLWAEDASEQMRTAIDAEVLEYAYADLLAQDTFYSGSPVPSDAELVPWTVGATAGRKSQNINLGITTAPLQLYYSGHPSPANNAVQIDIMDFMLRIALVMDENNLPTSGRFAVLPPWAIQMLKASDLRMANEMGDNTSVYRNGQVGVLDRMTVYSSNLLPTGLKTVVGGDQIDLAAGETVVLAGITNGLTFASQITKVETLRSERSFSNLMRGLQVYGRKVVDSKSLVGAVVSVGV